MNNPGFRPVSLEPPFLNTISRDLRIAKMNKGCVHFSPIVPLFNRAIGIPVEDFFFQNW